MGAAPVVCKVVEVKENQQIELYDQNRGRSNQYASCELENVTLFCLAAEQHKAPCNHARPTWSRNNNAAGAKAHNQENFTMNKNLKPSKAVEMGSSSCSGKENFQKKDIHYLGSSYSEHLYVGKCKIKCLKPLPTGSLGLARIDECT